MLEYLDNQCMDSIRACYRESGAMVRVQDITYAYGNSQGHALCLLLVWLAFNQTVELAIHKAIVYFLPGFRELLQGGVDIAADFAQLVLILGRKPGYNTEKVLRFKRKRFNHTHIDTPECKRRIKAGSTATIKKEPNRSEESGIIDLDILSDYW